MLGILLIIIFVAIMRTFVSSFLKNWELTDAWR